MKFKNLETLDKVMVFTMSSCGLAMVALVFLIVKLIFVGE